MGKGSKRRGETSGRRKDKTSTEGQARRTARGARSRHPCGACLRAGSSRAAAARRARQVERLLEEAAELLANQEYDSGAQRSAPHAPGGAPARR